MANRPFSCPNCGGPLTVDSDDTAVACSYCGSDVRITSDGRAVPFFSGADLQKAAGTGPAGPPSPEVLAELGALVRAGRKIDAIRRYRELFDTRLSEAKAAVDAIERGEPPPVWPPSQSSGASAPADWDEIRRLVAEGRKLEAVKRHRARTGKSIEEALQDIDALPESRRGTAPRLGAGCLRGLFWISLFFFLILAGCGQYVRTTALHACVVNQVTTNRAVRTALGMPVEVSPFVFVLGFSSESDFFGNTDRSAGYFIIASGPEGRAAFYVNAFESGTGVYGLQASPIPNPNDLTIRDSGRMSACRELQ